MITVKVSAVLEIASLLGGRKQTLEIPEGSCVKDLLDVLVSRYGRPLAERLYRPGGEELRKDIYLFLNGRNIYFQNGLATALKDGDELLFIPPAGGG